MPRQLLADYPGQSPRWDEMFDHTGQVREHWRGLWELLLAARPEEMRARLDTVARQVRENGITYNVYADPRGADRPWELDLLPLVVGHEEWSRIERAIAQRAALLNRILADVYGEQALLRDGLLPPALVHGHGGFLRPCRGIQPAAGVFLHVYAADLARSPDGRWWVIADRTQAPSGAGYALENRLVISRVFPEPFRDLRVDHLAGFFRTLRDSLAHWAPRDDGAPRIVLLTPGPFNETYFEHAYLARYLGFPLVEGSDLTVRDGRVWLKSLSGLQRVHVILRRQDDDFSDPLELRGDSALGVPGLTQVARLGHVLVANALGAGVLEGGALMGYLPKLCERLLGESLAMPSVATWWCGEPAALEDVVEKLDGLVLKPAFPQQRREPIFGQDLSGRERAEVIARLRERPGATVAQELVQLSQAPVWDRAHPRRLDARVVGLRVFACASPDGWVVMPGGLTRVGSDADARVLSMQRGGSSKDTWVLSSGPVSSFSLLRRPIGPADLVRTGANLSSRVVENLFWLGRYAERCDGTARLLRIALERLLEDADREGSTGWASIVGLCRVAGLLPEPEGESPGERKDAARRDVPPAARARERSLEEDLIASVVDPDRPPTLAANLRQLTRVAFHLRERLSVDNWRLLNRLVEDLGRQGRDGMSLVEAFSFLDRTVLSLMTLSGFASDGMTRDHGWRFLAIGRRIERLQLVSRALRHALRVGGDDLEWLLELGDSIVTYRSRYVSRPERLPVFDLLVLDRSNPRSVAFQVVGIEGHLGRLAERLGPVAEESRSLLRSLLAEVDLTELASPPRERFALDGILERIERGCARLSDELALRYFTHVAVNQRTVSV